MATTTVSTYEQQAIDFLENNKIEFKTTFAGFRKHFADDKEKRNTYEVTFLKRSFPLKELSVMFGQSLANTKRGEAPTAYDILACITKHDPEDFYSFCANYGYDEDSRKAFNIYESVLKEWKDVKSFFSSDEIEQLQGIQ